MNFITWIIVVTKAVVKLDVADFSYLYKPHNIEYSSLLQVGVPKRGIFTRVVAFAWHMLSSFWKYPFNLPPCPQNSVFFFANTQNQERSLFPLAQKIPNAYFAGLYAFGEYQIPLWRAYLMALPFFLLLVGKFVQSNGLKRKAFYYVFDEYWLSYGFYILARQILRNYAPSVIVVANDHVMWTRVLIRAAADEQISVIYVQHASVTERFPPLTVTYALLEGLDSAQKYTICGASTTTVCLVGIPRFDKYYSTIKTDDNLQTVGICVGKMDSREQFLPLYETLHINLPELNYILRPHPSDPRLDMWQEIATEISWDFSHSKQEDAFQFLSHVDVILAGESNILLEAALMNIFPIYYDFSKKKLDWYGFHKNGLTPYFEEPDMIVSYLKNMMISDRPDIRQKAKRYCATIDTNYDGHSTELAVLLIEGIARGQIDSQHIMEGIK